MGQVTTAIVSWAICGTIIGILAYRKNRSALGWGIVGGMFLIPGLLVLMFMPFVCPKCRKGLSNDEWKNRTCPSCGTLS